MTDDKTQRERDAERKSQYLDRAMEMMTNDIRAGEIADFADEAFEHGRRDSDAWRAAMREAARMVRKEADQYADSEIGRQKAITARYIASCIESLAASTPPATPSADVAGERLPVASSLRALLFNLLEAVDGSELHADARVRAEYLRARRYLAATPPEQPRSAAPPGDARPILDQLSEAAAQIEAEWSPETKRAHEAARAAEGFLREPEPPSARTLIETLLYWHDQGHVDESWWDAARAYLRPSTYSATGTPEAPPRTAAEPEKP